MEINEQVLEDVLKVVERPGRYLGGEWNEIRKDPSKAQIKVALAFPELYEIGMSYLGQKILYFLLNSRASVLAERVFTPWMDLERELRARKIPLYSLENRIPLHEFDIVGFSLLYELNYSNILTILDLGRIPILSSRRDLSHPLVIAGGPAAFNPEPVADIFDLFLIGDGEEAFQEIIDVFMTSRKETGDKTEVLKELAGIKGVYVPMFFKPFTPRGSRLMAVKPGTGVPARVEKRILRDFHKSFFPEKIIVPNIQVVFDRVTVEAARGCPQNCRFCQAAGLYFPFRMKSPDRLIRTVLNSLRSTGYEDASLASLSISDYPHIHRVVETLMESLAGEKISLSLSSLRPKGLSPEVARNIIKVRKTGFTLVPEAGTERMRRVINKKLSDDQLWEAVENAFSHGWRLLKLYFMVGLPTEREEDLEGIVSLVMDIAEIGRHILGSPPRINLSLSSFIPKPHTPFQWLGMEEEKVLQEKQGFLKSRFRKYRFVRIKEHPVQTSLLEGAFSRGDRRLSRVLMEAWRRGARFDSWQDRFDSSIWEKAFQFEGIDCSSFLQPLDRECILPWDHIDTGLEKHHLLRELDKALNEEFSPSCLERNCRECQGCRPQLRARKDIKEKIRVSLLKPSYLGQETDKVIRYLCRYSKTGRARFLSHLDLIGIIQRAFRRAGIPVVFSEGFHPSMLMSFPPALPLGMEGKEEILEFRSRRLIPGRGFLLRVNKNLPSGIRFFGLERAGESDPALNKRIGMMVYSVDMESREWKEAFENLKEERGSSGFGEDETIRELIERFSSEQGEGITRIALDGKRKKILLYCRHFPHRAPRPQKAVERLFGVEKPSFIMSREKILLDDASKKN